MKTGICLAILLCWAALSGPATAQTYPERPVRLIISFPPGGTVDILARTMAQSLATDLQQPFVPDNRPGAAGNIAATAVAKSSPDGYTLLVATINLATNPAMYKDLQYDPIKDFAPVSMLGVTPNVLVVNPALPAQSVQELIALARSKPGHITVGSPGSGTAVHLAAELFNNIAGLKMVTVPYKGPVAALNDIVAGRVDLMFPNLAVALPFTRAGKLRLLGVGSKQRHPSIPEVPTIAESGVAGYEALAWFGIVAPAGTPDAIVMKLNESIGKALRSDDTKQRLGNLGIDAAPSTPQQFAAYLREETAKWAKIIQATGLKAD
jgi:tripartite-type tricarboxylate transporter receptor subunit TctC